MVDKYAMLNGRGYPDTVNEDALVPAPDNIIAEATVVRPRGIPNPQRTIRLKASGLLDVDDEYNGLDLLFTSGVNEGVFRKIADYVGSSGEIVLASSLPAAPAVGDTFLIGRVSQRINSKITAVQGERVLLRISNLNVTRFYTLASTIPMQVVGKDARLLRGPDGKDLYYTTNSVNLGGGQAVDAIIDTTGVAPGTYLLYTTNLNYLTNDQEDFGGMMTEITVTAAP
jgi:FtsP/CotA-like multicopper oxidase with cupredoxin domain